jgi:hypothetical protein
MAGENSYFVAGSAAEQESGADWKAVELHPLESSAFSWRTFSTVSAADVPTSLLERAPNAKSLPRCTLLL